MCDEKTFERIRKNILGIAHTVSVENDYHYNTLKFGLLLRITILSMPLHFFDF